MRASSVFPWTSSILFVPIVFGWPAVVLSLALTFSGIGVGRWWLTLAGTLIASPFLLYVFATPRIGWFAAFVGASYLASAQAVARSQPAYALALATPFMLLACSVASLVLLH